MEGGVKSEIRVSGRSVVFEDLFDLEEIQVIQDQFARATGVASIITRPDGTPITKPSNFCRLCNDIIRNTEKGRANCFKSDASLGRSNPSGPIMQPCLSGGLWDGGAGISVEGVHIANWLIGQVRNETQSDERMLLYAEEIGADEDEFARALAEVKVMPTAQFKEICNALFLFANQLSQTAYQNLRQEQIIEERRVVERALADAKGYIDSIINSMPSVLIGIDAAFRITHWNNQAEKFENILAGEALGRKLHEVLPRFVDFVPHVQRAVKEHTIQSFSNVTRRIEARVIYEDIAVYPLLSETAEGAVIRIDDVTARFEMEQQLAQSRKMDAVGRLAGGIAHDFNNMLGGIIGAAEVLMDTVPSEGRKLLDVIVRSAERAADLTANLLSFSRKGKVSARSVDVHAVIRNTASLLERSLDKRIAIRLNLDAPLSTVIGDESQLHSALLNIGINAGQAMADGGELSFSSKIVYLDEAYCAASQFDLAPATPE